MLNVDVQQRDRQAVIHVADTGRGIPQEFWQSIFQPFFRVDKSLSRELGGAGLGLPLVWEIARLHGGRVWVEESNDNGSALAVTLLLSASITDTVRRYGRTSAGDLSLYDGDYSETQLMHHMVKMLVEEQTGLSVNIGDQMSQVNNFKAMVGSNHTCDLMISYDGTLLTTFFGQDVDDVPAGMSIYEYVNQVSRQDYGMTLLDQLGFDNTYAIGVPQALAEEYGLNCISDLIPIAGQLTFGAEQEFFTLEGSMKYGPFTEAYGLHFKEAKPVDMGLKYAAIENGSFDVSVVYATDGLNRKVGLKILEDDKGFFPDYNGAFFVREDVLEQYPELEGILNRLSGKIPTEQMAELTYQVDVLGRDVDEVAREFLDSLNL